MDSERIEQLLQKYWDCETTLEEEQALREYFNTAAVPENLKEAAALFQYFGEQQKVNLHERDFDSQVSTLLSPRSKMRSLVLNSLKIAAGISVVVASVWLVRTEFRQDNPTELTDTYNDPKQAFEETKKALQMISKNFGRAEKATANINLLNEAKDKIKSQENAKVDS